MQKTWRERLLRWMLRALWTSAAFVFLAVLDIWMSGSKFARWLEAHNPLDAAWDEATARIEVPAMLPIALFAWFVLTFALFVYVWRNFEFDDRKKKRVSIQDAIDAIEEARRKIREREKKKAQQAATANDAQRDLESER